MIFYIIKDLAKSWYYKEHLSAHFATFFCHTPGRGWRRPSGSTGNALGHESITTTEIYTHLDRDFLRSTLQQFHPAFK